jgi:hypothetical protein
MHIFFIYIMCDTAYIIQWDREEAVVTEPITYNHDPSLMEFLSLYLRPSPKLHGIDTMVSPAIENEVRPTRAKLDPASGTLMLKISVPQVLAINTPVDPNIEPGQTVTIVFAMPDIILSLPAACGTCACSVYDIEEDQIVFSGIHGM